MVLVRSTHGEGKSSVVSYRAQSIHCATDTHAVLTYIVFTALRTGYDTCQEWLGNQHFIPCNSYS